MSDFSKEDLLNIAKSNDEPKKKHNKLEPFFFEYGFQEGNDLFPVAVLYHSYLAITKDTLTYHTFKTYLKPYLKFENKMLLRIDRKKLKKRELYFYEQASNQVFRFKVCQEDQDNQDS